MHELVRSGDGIDGTGASAMGAADTNCFVNDGDTGNNRRFREWLRIPSEQVSESLDRFIAAGRAEIDRDLARNNCLRIGSATRVAALRALSLWE
jgi:hypothetical protein